MTISIILLFLGFFLLTKSADFFVEGASALALKFKIPQIIIGLTIVAIGTSAPEASVSIASALKGVTGVAIGNVLGSNIANIFLILGVTASICALTIQKNTIKFEIPFVAFITVLMCAMGYYFQGITRICALVLIFFFIVFLIYLFKISKDSKQEEITTKPMSVIRMLLYIVGGLVALVYSSDLTVNSAIDIAHRLNVSDRIIGLTIVAIGTSLPELVTCVVAAMKKQTDIAIGNIVGSNIFNILFVLGLTGVICPVAFDKAFLFDGIVALLSLILLFIFTFKKRVLTRIQGAIFLIMYVGYLAYLIIK